MKEDAFSVPTVEDVLRAVQDGDISIARAKELLRLAETGRAFWGDLPARTFSAQLGEDVIPGEVLGKAVEFLNTFRDHHEVNLFLEQVQGTAPTATPHGRQPQGASGPAAGALRVLLRPFARLLGALDYGDRGDESVLFRVDDAFVTLGDLRALEAYDNALDLASAFELLEYADVDEAVSAICGSLGDVFICSRHWSAWSYGTMSAADFHPADESEELGSDIFNALILYAKEKRGV